VSRFKDRLPSPALVVGLVALFVAMSGSAVAATTLLVRTDNIANGAVTGEKIANGAVSINKLTRTVRTALAKAGDGHGAVTDVQGPGGPQGQQGLPGQDGQNGQNGQNGQDGRDGLNPAVPVVNVPTIPDSSGRNPNPDSGDPGDGGWYFSGDGAGGSAALTNGELELDGPGIDANTWQGGIGIAKAFDNVRLRDLDALTYQWHVNQVNAASPQAPTIHITVTGLTNDSKFTSGFANLVYNPTLNGIQTPAQSVLYQSDGFAPNANWYSTTEKSISAPGGQDSPETLAAFAANNPNAVISQISLDNGGTSGGTGTFDAGADDLLLGFRGTNTRYDFGG
jgi:hypothetical protein